MASEVDLTKGIARYLVVILSVVAALITVVATVRNYGLQTASHRDAARQYAALRREIEVMSFDWKTNPDKVRARLSDIQRRWDWIADVAPNAPQRIQERSRAKLRTSSAVWSSSGGITTAGLNDKPMKEE
jgi:hypothetical protein